MKKSKAVLPYATLMGNVSAAPSALAVAGETHSLARTHWLKWRRKVLPQRYSGAAFSSTIISRCCGTVIALRAGSLPRWLLKLREDLAGLGHDQGRAATILPISAR